jgi:hypothetical protein
MSSQTERGIRSGGGAGVGPPTLRAAAAMDADLTPRGPHRETASPKTVGDALRFSSLTPGRPTGSRYCFIEDAPREPRADTSSASCALEFDQPYFLLPSRLMNDRSCSSPLNDVERSCHVSGAARSWVPGGGAALSPIRLAKREELKSQPCPRPRLSAVGDVPPAGSIDAVVERVAD